MPQTIFKLKCSDLCYLLLVVLLFMPANIKAQGEIKSVVDEMPYFPGGQDAMMKYLSENTKYPQGSDNTKKRVIVGFVVETDGTISEVKIIRPDKEPFNKEAIRVIKSMPKWNPGKSNGKAERVQYTLNVTFEPNKAPDTDNNKKGEMAALSDNAATVKSGVLSDGGQYKNQKSIVLPASTKIIAARAFRANSVVESIALPNGLTEIGDEAFSFCTNLKQIKIPSTVTKIGKQAFEGCDQLAVIVVPASVKTIGKEAFQLCENLSSASVPASLIDDIKGKQIFKGCNKLNSVSVVAANGRKAQDGKWYWKDAESPEVVKARELARQKAAEEEAKRAASAIENSYDFPMPDEDADINYFTGTDLSLQLDFKKPVWSGYAHWDNPRLDVKIASMSYGGRYFFVYGKNNRTSPMYESYRDCVAAAWFYFIHHKRRTRGLLEGQKW